MIYDEKFSADNKYLGGERILSIIVYNLLDVERINSNTRDYIEYLFRALLDTNNSLSLSSNNIDFSPYGPI